MAALLTGSFAIVQTPVYAGGSLPIPCPGSAACSALSFDPLHTKSGLPIGVSQLLSTANSLTINQGTAASAIYNWASFNISQGNTVQFIQPSAASVALNRIFDPNITTISGNLKANGQIYLVNPNGILFGSGANVNVGGLIASTLDLSDARIASGLLYDPLVYDPVFSSNATVTGSSLAASPGANPSIQVQSGATLYAAGRNQSGTIVSAGRVFLFAPTVENAGSITVDGGGQVILAAGSNVYLGSSNDPSLRGLLVEVSGTSNGVTIDPSGNITVAHGNITLMGLAVSQAGTLTATSALDANGSIRLIAREANPTLYSSDPDVLLGASVTGQVTLASGSKTEVVLDPTDTATAPLNDPTAAALRSTIEIEGLAVSIGGQGAAGSTVVQAHGGDISVTARTASSVNSNGISYQIGTAGNLLGTDNAASVISVGADAVIDASGLQNVPVNGALNFVYIDRLTSSNLANAPLERAGFLLGQSLWVNLAQAPSWLDVSNLQAAIAATQAQRNTAAGTISLNAEGSVQLAKGSVLNVSGGSTDVTAAVGRTSELIEANGSVVNIANAPANVQYVGFTDHGSYTVVDPLEGINETITWQVPNYTQVGGYAAGASAGTIQIYAPQAQLNGTLLGQATASWQQRSTPVAGGLLQIGSANASQLDSEAGISRASIVLTTDPGSADQLIAGQQSGAPIVLDTATLAANGFTRLDLTSDGVVDLAPNSPLNLGPNGQLTIRANAVAIDSSLQAPGGAITIMERPLTVLPGGDTLYSDLYAQRELVNLVTDPNIRGSVVFAAGTSVSAAGLWTNDEFPRSNSQPTTPIVLSGGTISISGRTVDVSQTSFDVSSGGYLSLSGAFSGGSGGTLSLKGTYQVPATLGNVDEGVLDLGSDFASRMQGYGAINGGTLDLYSPSLAIGGTQGANPSFLALDPGIGDRGFQTFGFSAYDLASLTAGTNFTPTVLKIQNSPSLDVVPSANSLPSQASLQAALPGQAYASSVSISASNSYSGQIDIGANATVNAGIGGTVALAAGFRMQIDGALAAPAGAVSATLGAPSFNGVTLDQINQRAIVLDPGASIDVDGASLVTANASGLRVGNVLAAGTVSLNAPVGTVAIETGSSIDARGTTDTVDILLQSGRFQLQTVASAGGTVELSGGNGVLVEGSIDAHGGSPLVGGGQLSVSLIAPPQSYFGTGQLPPAIVSQLTGPMNLTISDTQPTLLPNDPSSSFAATANQAFISIATLNDAGFAHVWLQSPDVISLGSGAPGASQTLTVSASIVLAAPAIDVAPGWNFAVKSPYIAIGPAELLSTETSNTGFSFNAQQAASGGAGTIQFDAAAVDVVGNVSLVDVGQATISATGDVRGIGIPNQTKPGPRDVASLQFGGNLTIDAARLYPVTQTDFSITGPTTDPNNGSLLVSNSSAAPANGPVLSAGGSLSISVGDLDVQGQLLAPLGSINVTASRSLTLEAGSLVSVAGDALVPYGSISNGTTWTYGVPPGNSNVSITPYTIASANGVVVPSKGITLTAATLLAQSGATINVSSGGEVLGTGFVAGPGGSYDLSQNFPYSSATSRNPFFALVPSMGTSVSAFDPQIFSNLVLNAALPSLSYASFQMGATITIATGSALPAGTYTVMPVRYALLPGAFAVEAASGYQDLQPGSSVAMPDGTAIVAGRLGDAGAGTIASRWSGYRVYTDEQFRTLSEFQDYTGSSFFDTIATGLNMPLPRVANDAGVLQIAGTSVLLDSTIDAQHASSAQGADVSIDAPTIVVADTVPLPSAGAAAPSTLTLAASTLSQLNAQTLVLGAIDTRTPLTSGGSGTAGTTLTLSNPVASNSVSITATSPLSAGELILSSASVNVADQAQLRATTGTLVPTSALVANGDGALLYLGSAAVLPSYSRLGASAPGTATVGDLTIGAAKITGGSLILDATQTQTYASGTAIDVGTIDLSAAVVNLGSVPTGTFGVNLNSDLLATLGSAQGLVVTTLGGIDVYGNATLGQLDSSGQPLLNSLALVGPGIAGFGDATASVQFNAGHIAFSNPAKSTGASTGTGLGELTVTSAASSSRGTDGSISVSGNIGLSGFQNVGLSASGVQAAGQTVSGTGDLVFTGAAGDSAALNISGTSSSLSVSATRITAQSGVNGTITVPGSISIAASGPAAPNQTQQLGASLQITAGTISDSGRIDLPAGIVDLQASDGISLNSGALIRVAGATQAFASTSADAAAGAITLTANAGSITEGAGATLDVSGSGTTGDAGSLNLLAPFGTVTLLGNLALAPGGQGRGAQIAIDGGNLDNANALINVIASGTSGAALDSVSLRARSGDIVVGGASSPATLTANSITLEADGRGGATDGSIDIAGSLVASGNAGGQISIYANNQIMLEAGGVLDVHATGTSQPAGSVLLSARVNTYSSAPSTLDAIVLQSGATVNLQGGAGGTDGTITLQSRVAPTGNDVEIAPVASGVILGSGATKIVEAVVIDANTGPLTLNAALMSSEAATLSSLMSSANVSAITQRLGFSSVDPNFHLRPGLEIQSTGDMTITDPIDFSTGLQSVTTGAGTFTWRYGGATLATSEPGELILRSGGNLNVNANISDGFLNFTDSSTGLPADTLWTSGNSWSYILTGGADLAASNPNQTIKGAGSLNIGTGVEPGVIVRTGTGSIALNAGQNVVLRNGASQQDNVVYTAGVNSVAAPAFPPFPTYDASGNFVYLRPVLAQGGGNVTIVAQGDVLGTDPASTNQDGSSQTVNEWLFRYGVGTTASPSAWWTDFDSFQQGFGALGGGNLSIVAGGDIVRVGAVVPSNGYAIGGSITENNAGALTVTAGGSVVQGLYYDEAGTLQMRATSLLANSQTTPQQQDVRFAQGNNELNIVAREGAKFDLPFNPTVASPSANLTAISPTTMFFTYGAQSSLNVQVAADNLSLQPSPGGLAGLATDASNNFAVAPTNVQIVAFGGSITGGGANNDIFQYPDPNGQLHLLADGGISQIRWTMSQADVGILPTPGAAAIANSVDMLTPAAGALPLHANDPTTAEIVARNGSLTSVVFNLPKTTEISAGANIGPFAQIEVQNSNADSLTRIAAGNQIVMTSGTPYDHIYIGGEGAAQIVSGSSMNLGTDGGGIVSIGNLDNPRLPAQGATLIVAAGTGTLATPNGPVAASPNYLNLIENFVLYDAFASSGANSAALNAQVLSALRADPTLLPLVNVLVTGLASRGLADDPTSAFQQQLARLSPAELAIGAVKLASAIQVVANQQFVASSNSDTFAPAYAVFNDLFPNLVPAENVINHFVLNNPFASALNPTALRDAALQGLPADLVAVIHLGLSSPSSVNQPGSEYSQALAAIDPSTLEADARALLANVLQVAGISRDQLSASGQLTGSGSPYAKELTALAASFTAKTIAGLNDLQMDYSQIKAEQTGSVAVLTPQGSVVVGQSSAPALDTYAKAKTAAELGIFTLGGGDVIGMARDDFDVYRSRVFTVAGGDITLWSSDGNIDAGRGPRDVAVASPPQIATDPNTGVVYLNFSASVTGSGIGALVTSPDQPPSNINLMAPVGYVDAGEAGIRAQNGTVVLGTNLVLNGNNIQAASGVSGGAVVASPPPPLPPAANTSQGDRAVEDAQREAMAQQLGAEERSANQLHVRVSGEFLGFERECDESGNATGDSDCKKEKDKSSN